MSSEFTPGHPWIAAALARALICSALALPSCSERSDKVPASATPPVPPSQSDPGQAVVAPPPAPAAPRETTDEPNAGDWVAVCDAVEGAEFPTSDLPSPQDKAQVKSGDSVRFYYGIGTPVDDVRARHAAFLERERGDELVLGGSAVLTMLYANGRGVERNLNLAIKLACTVGHAPAEIEGRVSRLDSMKSSRDKGTFDFCDDITSGFMMGHCKGLGERRRGNTRQQALEAVVAGWPAAHRKALDVLMRAFEEFVQARSANEVDLSGTDRAAALIEAEASLRQALVERLKEAEQGTLPGHGPADYAEADTELNRAYARALSSDLSDSTVTPAGIRATEKVWIRYRDAWVTFGAQRYPSVAAEVWKTLLTRERIQQLSEF
jgi:uncharacterized protein YecT (DUF1311 family)